MKKTKKILFTGGGTGGPTVPLLAVYQELKKDYPNWRYYWLGTYKGPEKDILKKYDIYFRPITAAKLPRYFSIQILWQPFYFLISIIQAAIYLLIWRPQIILSVGGYVSVPVIILGKIMGIPSLIHQQDIKPGLANDIMSFYAKQVTVSVPELLTDFKKAKVVGNPVRQEVLNYKDKNKKDIINSELNHLSLNPDLPLLVITGGGTGAEQINNLTMKALPELTKFCQIVHLTGKNRVQLVEQTDIKIFNNYTRIEFLTDEYPPLIAAADVVVSRAGMSALTELAVLGKAALVIPMPNSHQIKNAEYFQRKNAIVMFNIDYEFNDEKVKEFVKTINDLISGSAKRDLLAANIKNIFPADSAQKLTQIIKKML